jgi:hypothetical protein
MDESLLLAKLNTGHLIFDLILCASYSPLKTKIPDFAKWLYSKVIKNNDTFIKMVGSSQMVNGLYIYDYTLPMKSIFHYIKENKLSNKLCIIDNAKNEIDNGITVVKHDITYGINDNITIKLPNKMIIDICIEKISKPYTHTNTNTSSSLKIEHDINIINLVIKSLSSSVSIEDIKTFLDKIINNYQLFLDQTNNTDLYHFMYRSGSAHGYREDVSFHKKIFSSKTYINKSNLSSFDCLFSTNKQILKKTIERLNNIEYYKKTGTKRQSSYIFHGPPGTGKTCHITALANYSNRHIVEIHISRIHTNLDFEKILNLHLICGISVNYDQIIIVFDEIDQLFKKDSDEIIDRTPVKSSLCKFNEDQDDINFLDGTGLNEGQILSNKSNILYPSKPSKNILDDKLSLEFVLSQLDGISSFPGLIIIATTNYIDRIPEQLCRYGRLTPLYFGYMVKNEIIEMIEFYYEIKLTSEEIGRIEIISSKNNLAHSKLKFHIEEEYRDDLEGLIEFLSNAI